MMNKDFLDGNWFRAFTPLDYKSGSCITLCVSELSSIMSNYLDEVWFREMMQLMVMFMI
jgi:hypothetical protein